MRGQSMPYVPFKAENDGDFYTQLAQYERDKGVKHVPGTLEETSMRGTRQLSEPPKSDTAHLINNQAEADHQRLMQYHFGTPDDGRCGR